MAASQTRKGLKLMGTKMMGTQSRHTPHRYSQTKPMQAILLWIILLGNIFTVQAEDIEQQLSDHNTIDSTPVRQVSNPNSTLTQLLPYQSAQNLNPQAQAIQPIGLSGIAYLKALDPQTNQHLYVAVSDKQPGLWLLMIQHQANGELIQAKPLGFISLVWRTNPARKLTDLEAITATQDITKGNHYDLYIAEESGTIYHATLEHNQINQLLSESSTQVIKADRFAQWPTLAAPLRHNRGIESLTHFHHQTDRTFSIIMANEDASVRDGDVASQTDGAIVRLYQVPQKINPGQKNTPILAATYLTDSINGDNPLLSPNRKNIQRSGLVEITSLDSDHLLTLERAAGLGLRSRLYLCPWPQKSANSPNISNTSNTRKPLTKKLLWQQTYLNQNANFEAMTLGPKLKKINRNQTAKQDSQKTTNQPDSQLLILIADSGTSGTTWLHSLVIHSSYNGLTIQQAR